MKLKYLIAVFIGACSYGVLSTIVKVSYREGIKTAEVSLAQFITGWLMITVFWILAKDLPRINRKKKMLLMAGGVPSGLVGIFYYLSLETVEASFAIILLFQFVWMGILIEGFLDRKMPRKKTFLSIVILFIGTIFSSNIINIGDVIAVDSRGVVFGLLAAAAFAIFIFANARVAPELPAVQRSFYMVTGSLLVVAVTFLPEVVKQGAGDISSIGYYGTLLGFFGVFIPPFLFAYGMPKIGSGMGSILGSAELPVTIGLSMMILKESVTYMQWVGVILILLAIIVSNLPRFKKRVLKAEE
ncbi:EamA family transporter [Bacillus sp. AK031]